MAHPARLTFRPAKLQDFEALVGLRTRALRESLERLGRFDPDRVRARLKDSFDPATMRILLLDGEAVGCITLRRDNLVLATIEHFYLEPAHQGHGLGGEVLSDILAWADAERVTVRLGVLRESDANRFYQRHGFSESYRDAWDIFYVRSPATQ